MNFIIWLVVGGLIGWLASIIMKTNAQQGVLLNIVVGIARSDDRRLADFAAGGCRNGEPG